jgi:pimeloyl-ACP methyl ester carboxylesterase
MMSNYNELNIIKNIKLYSKHGNKPFGLDIYQNNDGQPKPLVLFIHGFKGFKDWGHFPALAKHFAHNGFVFVKFNFSHNGTSYNQPHEFVDLEAFGHNNFSKELDDLHLVVDFIQSDAFKALAPHANIQSLYCLGFSRGGGIAILHAAADHRVKKLATWSAVSDMVNYWSPETAKLWKEKGVMHTPNSRTGQDMPMYYQLYEDLQQNAEKFDIGKAAAALSIPFLVVHGSEDETLPLKMALDLKAKNNNAQLHIVKNSGHTYGGFHPFNGNPLPQHTLEACQQTIEFFNQD